MRLFIEKRKSTLSGEEENVEYITSPTAPVAEQGTQNVFNFEFNGDITDKDQMINLIKNAVNRDSTLLNNAGI
jgi:hypothetical protein